MSGALSSGILCFLLTEMLDEFINDEQCGGRSSVGRAADCDSVCRGFEPHRPPHFLIDLSARKVFPKSATNFFHFFQNPKATLTPVGSKPGRDSCAQNSDQIQNLRG